MRRFLPRFSLAAFALVALGTTTLACTGAAEEDVEDQEGAYRAKPQGQDSQIGSLLVDAPAPPAGAQLLVRNYTVGRSRTTDLGKTTSGLSAGETFVEMTGTLNAYPMIKAGATTTIHLGGVMVTHDAARMTVGLDLEANAWLSLSTPAAIPDVRAPSSAFIPGAGPTVAQAVVAGTYLVGYGFLDGASVKVSEGAFATLNLSANEGRRIVRIVASPRELPDASCGGFNGQRAIRITGPTREGSGKVVQVPLDKPFEVGQHDEVAKASARAGTTRLPLSYGLPCLATNPTLPLGGLGTGPIELKLGRLDVDDIDVTQNDGTVKPVRGAYQVYDTNGNMILTSALATNTGVDLPPGTYDVVATYPKTDGTRGTWKTRFTTP